MLCVACLLIYSSCPMCLLIVAIITRLICLSVYIYFVFLCLVIVLLLFLFLFFFFKQKPAYEMRISDWSSDVCSSDLVIRSPVRTSARLPPAAASGATCSTMVP